MKTKADSLYELILVKRIRSELPGLIGGMLPRETIVELATHAREKNFAEILHSKVKARSDSYLSDIDFNEIVNNQREMLEKE
ncbi:MAG: hypothetical protein FJ147_19840 [Deltaproteobacteria bacterium]|nr:hypothetical protein [Deltaproteobacteria bacterium]